MLVGVTNAGFPWMDEGFITFINTMADKSFNNGRFLPQTEHWRFWPLEFSTIPQKASPNIPDVQSARNLGTLAYNKPGIGLTLLRESIWDLSVLTVLSAIMYTNGCISIPSHTAFPLY